MNVDDIFKCQKEGCEAPLSEFMVYIAFHDYKCFRDWLDQMIEKRQKGELK